MESAISNDTRKKTAGRSKIKRIVTNSLIYAGMSVLALVLMIPYFYMFFRAFMTSDQVKLIPVELFPKPFSFEAFVQLFTAENYFKYLLQTLKIVGFNLIAVPVSASFVAYGFSKYKFIGKEAIFACMLGTMMLPGIVTQIPLYVLFANIGWLDTVLPLTLPNLFGGGAIYIFLIRQYMVGIPYELEEAAKIDGANPLIRYFRITLPLCVPVLVFIMITVFNAGWSDFYGPLIYMSAEGKETLAYAIFKDSLYKFVTPDKANLKMAAGLFMSVFPTILFVVFQNQLIDGVAVSAVKG
ncbi:MAG: carbohydrate ABC transporter permease [Coriobacteriales bacterium]|jgi:ABC transporter, permease protein